MTDDEEDLPDVGELLTRREYVIHEIEHLIQFRIWPDDLARMLDYANADSLQAALHKWKRHDLAVHFERWRYDGNVPAAVVASQQKRKERTAA